MASASDWANGYLRQAQADLRAAQAVQGVEPSAWAMLVQMTLEKVSKAALLQSGTVRVDDARSSHAAAHSLMLQLLRNRRACQQLGLKRDDIRYNLAPLVHELEQAHPDIRKNGPHLEYPWEAAGEVRWPAEHLALCAKFGPRSTQGARLLELADRLCRGFHQAFC